MKNIKVLLMLSVLTFCSCQSVSRNAIRDLEKVIRNKDQYRHVFNDRIKSLKHSMSEAQDDSLKWVYADTLFYEYIHNDLDSAYEYVRLQQSLSVSEEQKFLSDLDEVRVLYLKRLDNVAFEKFTALRASAGSNPSLVRNYLSCGISMYSTIGNDLKIPGRQVSVSDSLDVFRQKYMLLDTLSVYGQKIHAQYLRDHGDLAGALDIFLSCYGTEDNYHDKTSTAYNLGMLYGMTGDRDKKMYWLAKSGEYDFMTFNRDYMSIYQIALTLYEEGKLQQADRYIQMNLMDAIAGGFNNRIVNSGKAHSVIAEAAEAAAHKRMVWISIAFTGISLLSVLLVYMLLYMRKQSYKLKESHNRLSIANDEIKERNDKLREANLIKDNYVFRYMNLSVMYLEKMEALKHDIRLKLKEQTAEEVINDLRNPSEVYMEYKKYYQIFDETFLGIFPNFREAVNNILRPECRLPVSDKKTLSTEFRILAVIRLGISESGKIASFLKCAPATIYTYRTKMRNAAICDKDDFEDMVRNL